MLARRVAVNGNDSSARSAMVAMRDQRTEVQVSHNKNELKLLDPIYA
jgi:hypothetical protein